MSDSDSDSDSGDSDKEIVVRHAGVRDPSTINTLRVAEPKVNNSNAPVAVGAVLPNKPQDKQNPPVPTPTSARLSEKKNEELAKAPSLTRTMSADSNSSEVSVREEDIFILMRSIPEYKQYDDENARSNDSYLRSAIRSMPENLLDAKDEYGNTLLLIACQYSCIDLVKLLLKRGADANVVNTSGACCLHFACYKDSLSMPIVELLLQRNVSVNVAETLYGCTPLHYAASTGEVVLCRLLIAHGAYIHAHDFDNCSSVDYAVDAGMMELADYLRAELHNTNTRTNIHTTTHTTTHSANVSSPMSTKSLHNSVKERHSTDYTTTPTKPPNTPQRMIINTNSASIDEFDYTDNPMTAASNASNGTNNRSVEGPGSSGRPPLPVPTVHYNISSSGTSGDSAKASPITNTSNTSNANTMHTADYKHSGSPIPTSVVYSNKSSPDNYSIHSTHSAQSAYSVGSGSVHSSSYQADASTSGYPSSTNNKRAPFQPISPSPYKPLLPPSPSNNHTNISSSSSGDDRVVHVRASPSVNKGFFKDDEIHTNTNTTHTNHTPPPLPIPSHMQLVEDSNYSNIDNITSLTPEKFELYIEQAKFNAKLSKERELHKSVLLQRDGKIASMQGEINSMKKTISNYKEEVHALSAKLDMLQLPFIEATNTLQDELLTLRRENSLLREQLKNSGGGSNGGSGKSNGSIFSGKG